MDGGVRRDGERPHRSLLEEALDGDLQAVSEEIERVAAQDKPSGETNKPKRQPLPAVDVVIDHIEKR
jgi:hypothetical protein